MKKNAPKILAVVLLSLVAVLMIVAGSGSLTEIFKPTPNNNDDVPTVDAVGDNNEQTDNELNSDKLDNDVALPEEDVDYFPIKAEQNPNYRYYQNVELFSPTLNATHSTTEFTFLIVTHQTDKGAFKVVARTQTIIKIDEEGTIISRYSIKVNMDTEYLYSKVTSQGLVVAVKDNSKTYLYTISLDFKQAELIELPLFSSVTLFALNDSFLVFGTSSENVVYKIKNNTIVSSSVLQSGIIKEVYDFSNYYAVFSSGIEGYSFIKLSTDLKLISTTSIQNKSILAVAPIMEENKQKFIVAEHTISGVEIVKYDMSFSVTNAERVGIGLAESAKVFINGESIFLLLHASTDRLYLIDKNLSFTSSNNTTFKGITELYDCATTLNGYLTLYTKEDILTLTDIRNDGTIKSINLDIITNSAFLNIDRQGNYIVTYQTEKGIVSIGIN